MIVQMREKSFPDTTLTVPASVPHVVAPGADHQVGVAVAVDIPKNIDHLTERITGRVAVQRGEDLLAEGRRSQQ